MKKTLLLFTTICISFISHSQDTFQAGSVLKNNQETANGFIKSISENEVAFKKELNGKETIYSSKSIKEYTITEPFKKFGTFNNSITKKTSFYEYIIEGKISLLFLNDNYFINDANSGLKILETKKVETSTNKGVFESTLNRYKGVLSYYAKDCKDLHGNNVKYTRKSLSNFVKKLNECKNSEYKDYSESSRINLFEAGVTLGGNFATFRNEGIDPYITSGPSLGLSVGGFVSLSPDITRYNLSFLLGVEYNQKKVDYTYDQPNFIGSRTITHDASVIEPYIVALYQPFYNKKGRFNPYIGFGTSFGFTTKHTIEVKESFGGSIVDRDLDQTFSVMFKLGTFININDKKLLFEIANSGYSYQYPSYVEDYGSNFQVKVGYVFNLK